MNSNSNGKLFLHCPLQPLTSAGNLRAGVAHQDLVARLVQGGCANGVQIILGCAQRGLVDEVVELRTTEARGAPCKQLRVNILRKRFALSWRHASDNAFPNARPGSKEGMSSAVCGSRLHEICNRGSCARALPDHGRKHTLRHQQVQGSIPRPLTATTIINFWNYG